MIGVIDSGSGGLSVLKALREQLPKADYVYFGDIKNAPYGNKTHAELSRLTVDALSVLKAKGVQNVVSACNSVSASMAISLFDTLLTSQHIIEMVGPTVAALKNDSRRIALCATEATVYSGMYENGFRMVGKNNIISIAIPELAGQIEFGASEADIETVVKNALLPHQGAFDVLILACTHYPLVRTVFERVVGSGVEIFDPAEAVSLRAKEMFTGETKGSGQIEFLISQDSGSFRDYVKTLFEEGTYAITVL